MSPSDLRYTKEHEWVAVDGAAATIGITDFAQAELGDIVYVELPEVGRKVAAGDVLGTIESVKAVSEIYAPVSGTVSEINASLAQKPETINTDAQGAGWICKIALADPREAASLMDAAAYRALTGG
ncbi:MAG TPA: glycine cleavage system protein GcvH [Candidatus Polarisedimenticolaceae bacterium]|nr:glycine cleavage system protein GcvH [Candidatus Polarisedimenticolaceae bacterium]